MKFEQIRDVIGKAVLFHKTIGDYFHHCLENTDNSRLEMLLNYLIDHEEILFDGLLEYKDRAPVKVLDTWIQFSDCSEKFNAVKENLTIADPSVENIQELTVQLYNCIITQFESLSETAETGEVKAMFLNVSQKEKKELKKLVRNFQMMNEL